MPAVFQAHEMRSLAVIILTSVATVHIGIHLMTTHWALIIGSALVAAAAYYVPSYKTTIVVAPAAFALLFAIWRHWYVTLLTSSFALLCYSVSSNKTRRRLDRAVSNVFKSLGFSPELVSSQRKRRSDSDASDGDERTAMMGYQAAATAGLQQRGDATTEVTEKSTTEADKGTHRRQERSNEQKQTTTTSTGNSHTRRAEDNE